jgi:hypothetical protein
MNRTYAHAIAKKTPSEVNALSQRVGKVLRALGAARGSERLTADEVLIFLALGHLGQSAASNSVFIRPVTCIDLADVLNIPKETVRRKVARLVELQLAEATTRGILLQNQEEWRRLAESVGGDGAL